VALTAASIGGVWVTSPPLYFQGLESGSKIRLSDYSRVSSRRQTNATDPEWELIASFLTRGASGCSRAQAQSGIINAML